MIKIKELWKPILEYEKFYSVSNTGKIFSLRNNRILKNNKNSKGYRAVQLCKDHKCKSFLVHRLVANVFVKNPDNLNEINHKDEDKTNNCSKNLEWCTHKYNMNYGSLQKRQRITKEWECLKRELDFEETCLMNRY